MKFSMKKKKTLRATINQWQGTVTFKRGPTFGPFWGVIVTVPGRGVYSQRVHKSKPGTREEAKALAKLIRQTGQFDVKTASLMLRRDTKGGR